MVEQFRKVRGKVMINAAIATVKIGLLELEGLHLEDGSYGVAIPQIAELTKTDRNQATRSFKRLMGKGFKTDRCKTILNRKSTNYITLREFERLIMELAFSGNQNAITFMRGLAGLALEQLFADAFKVKFEAEERQLWLKNRQQTIDTFKPLTGMLKKHGFNDNWEYARFIHQLQSKLGIVDGTRDSQGNDNLAKLIAVQAKLTAYMECGIPPYQALEKV